MASRDTKHLMILALRKYAGSPSPLSLACLDSVRIGTMAKASGRSSVKSLTQLNKPSKPSKRSKPKEPSEPKTSAEWQELACSRLVKVLQVARKFPGLHRVTSNKKPWTADLQLVGKVVMSRVNFTYRKKQYPTDVLSFPAPPPFVKQGMLGELLICLPVLKAQAKDMKISPQCELDVLLVHGVLHLLGFDHERGAKDALAMARWETRILDRVRAKTKNFERGLGLIERSNSGKESR